MGGMGMEEWTDEFIRHAQQELVAMVKDWQYDYGPSDEECAAMLLWMVLRLKPDLNLGPDVMKQPVTTDPAGRSSVKPESFP